ncbi:hypothetical protein HHK36_002978 [Tetracentron sinense]|uniref:Uncharacterized protein n=1 Tax=Tetracentron sinense TaxID=13715 RepID=A0A835DRM0_TETSI|nr:hypothetical protein HHK36_002978 [Tetracentron sinense]
MDKARDVRRGASRFLAGKRQSKLSRRKLCTTLSGGGDLDFSEKSKKERDGGLSLLGRASSSNEDSEMGGASDGEEELRQTPPQPLLNIGSNKRFKLHRKQFDEYNTVDPAAVPRKLRSAMSKRNHELISPPLPVARKLHLTSNGIKSPQIGGVKKFKQNRTQGGLDPLQVVLGPITKDEEEVVETLYALAGMFSNDSEPFKSIVNRKTLEEKSSPLTETRENSTPDSEAPKEKNVKFSCLSTTAEATDLSPSVEGSPGETVKVNLSTEPLALEQNNILNGHKIDLESDNSVPRTDAQRITLLCKSKHTDQTRLGNAVSFAVQSELLPETRLVPPKQHEAPLPGRKPENMLCPAAAVAIQQEQQHPIKESKESVTRLADVEGGPTLWPGLSATGSCGSGVHGPSFFSSSAIKAPTWLDSSTSVTRLSCAGNGVSKEMIIADRRKSGKRCAGHIYISRFIRTYQLAERKDRLSVLPNQLKPNEGTKPGVVAANNLTGMSNINGSASAKNPNESISILLDKRLQQDQQQASMTYGLYTPQKQSGDFLSLPSGNGGLEVNDSRNTVGNELDPSVRLHVPYQHLLAQHHQLMPFSLPHTRYSSSPYPDQLTTAQQVQLQLPQYLGSPFYDYGPPQLGHTSSGKQQQQHQMWLAQLETQYRSGGIPGSHFPTWQNGRHDSPLQFPCAQAVFPPPPSSLEVLGPKYSPGLQHQQLFAITSSLSSPRGKRQHHHLAGGCDGGGGGFHSESSSHLQLLCNAKQL